VWRLYLEEQSVFEGVFADLRAKGTVISRELATDLIHEFLIERAPFALATFQPDRGELRSWLFVVFRRFVLGTYRSSQRSGDILKRWQKDLTATPSDNYPGLEQDLLAVKAVTAGLPEDERRALTTFFGADGASVRAVARALGISRWKATRLILQGAARVVRDLRVDIGVNESELGMLIAGTQKKAQANSGVVTEPSAEELRLALQRVGSVLAQLLEIERSEEKNP